MSATETQWPTVEEYAAVHKQLDEAVSAAELIYENLRDCGLVCDSFEAVGVLAAFVARVEQHGLVLASIAGKLAVERDDMAVIAAAVAS